MRRKRIYFPSIILIFIIGLSPMIFRQINLTHAGDMINSILVTAQPGSIACASPPLKDKISLSQLGEAVDILQHIHQGSLFPQVNLLLGRAYCLLGNPGKAVQSYKDYLQVSSQKTITHLELGFAYEQLCLLDGQPQAEYLISPGSHICQDEKLRWDIASEWQQAALLQSDMIQLGNEAENINNTEEALAWYYRAAIISPQHTQPWFVLAQLYQTMKDWSNAYSILQMGIHENNQSQGLSNLYFQLGIIQQFHLVPADPAAAKLAYHAALLIDDYSLAPWQKASTYHNLGLLFAWKNQWLLAVNEYDKGLSLLPNDYWSLVDMSKALWHLGIKERAYKMIFHALEIDSNNYFSYIVLAQFSKDDKNLDRAREYYEKALEIYPQSTEALNGLLGLSLQPQK